MVYDREFFAKKLKLARKQAKFTQEELAEQIGISAKQLSRIEMATYIPSLPTFLKLITTLKINITDFGLTINPIQNSIKDEIFKIIYNAEDKELIFYYEMLKSAQKNIENYKQK